MWLKYSLLSSFIVLVFVGIWIYFFQKKEAYRFFFPAFSLFVLFSLVPISYSVYVSMTNLKTGHLLDRSAVIELFLEEKILKPNSQFLNYQIFKDQKYFYLKVEDFQGPIVPGSAEIKIAKENRIPELAQVLKPFEVLSFIESHPEAQVQFPDGKIYQLFRSDLLAQTQSRYELQADGTLKDLQLNEVLTEDKAVGQFKLSGEIVGPGYYTFVGLSNYKDLFFKQDIAQIFFGTFAWTFSWAFFSVLLSFSLGAFLAVMLNRLSDRSRLVYRLLLIIPYSIPFFISVLVFKGLLNKDFGDINSILSYLKISPIPWLESKYWARISVLMVNLWLGFPYMLLVITGILQSIPKSIYEASSLEGATEFQNFRYLTFPSVIRSMVPLLIGSFAFNLNNFIGIYLLTGGGPVIADASTPLGETDILISYTYRLAFEGSQGQNFALASTVSMFIFFVIVLVSLFNFKISQRLSSVRGASHES